MRNKIFNQHDCRFFIIVAIISVILFIFKLPFPWTDDLAYKQAGASFAKGIGFAAPGLKGYLPEVERVFAHCPPIYPFLFGLWFSIFNFSLSSSLALSILICYLIMFLYVLLFKTKLKKFPLYIYGLIFYVWCNAVVAIHRPDTLFLLLALSTLLIIFKITSERMTFITQFSIIMLLGLSLAASPGLGLLFLVYLFFVLVSIRGFNMQTIRTCCIWSFFSIALFILFWWIFLRSDFYLVKSQFIDPQILRQILGKHMTIKEGLIFTFYRTFQYIPLTILLTVIFFACILLYKNKRKFLISQFLGIAIVLSFLLIKLPHKSTYITVFLSLAAFIFGMSLISVIENSKNLYFKKMLVLATFFSLLISCAPVIRMAFFPLTWNKADTYDYNIKLIQNNIKKGSKVLTDVIFWYGLNKDYEIFDAYFASGNLYDCSYVLSAGCGSGKPDLPVLPRLNDEQRRYFYENFTKQLSTLSNEPNKIFGIPISRSRWSYRFVLYKRK